MNKVKYEHRKITPVLGGMGGTQVSVELPRLKVSTILPGQVRTNETGEYKILIVSNTLGVSYNVLSLNGKGLIEALSQKILELFPWVIQDDQVMYTGGTDE